MIKNIRNLPAGVRHQVFDIDWLTRAELNKVAEICIRHIHETGWSRARLAREAKVSEATVYSLFAGRKIGRESVLSLASALPSNAAEAILAILDDVGSGVFDIQTYSGLKWTLYAREEVPS